MWKHCLALHSFRMASQISCYSRLLGRDFSKPDGNLVIYNRELADRPSEQWNQRNIKSSNYKRCDDKPSKHLENSSKLPQCFHVFVGLMRLIRHMKIRYTNRWQTKMRDHAICGRVYTRQKHLKSQYKNRLQTTWETPNNRSRLADPLMIFLNASDVSSNCVGLLIIHSPNRRNGIMRLPSILIFMSVFDR